MPAYSFECQKCKENFTLRVSMAEKENATCPKCSSNELKQIFKSIGIISGGKSTSQAPPSCGGCSGGSFS